MALPHQILALVSILALAPQELIQIDNPERNWALDGQILPLIPSVNIAPYASAFHVSLHFLEQLNALSFCIRYLLYKSLSFA